MISPVLTVLTDSLVEVREANDVLLCPLTVNDFSCTDCTHRFPCGGQGSQQCVAVPSLLMISPVLTVLTDSPVRVREASNVLLCPLTVNDFSCTDYSLIPLWGSGKPAMCCCALTVNDFSCTDCTHRFPCEGQGSQRCVAVPSHC